MIEEVVRPVPPRRVAVRAGNYQSAKVGRPFSAQLAVMVTDPGGQAVPGARVTFKVDSGSATFGHGARSATVTTGRNGLGVSAVVLAGPTTGSVQITASTQLSLRPATFTLRVIPGPYDRLRR
jgi:hypothetical protein